MSSDSFFDYLFGRSALDRAEQTHFDDADPVELLTGPLSASGAQALADWQSWQDKDD